MTHTEIPMTITEQIRAKVQTILSKGNVEFFIGYEAGADPLHVTPLFVQDEDELGKLEWNAVCINNLSTYLKRYRNQKIGLLLKGCDSRSVIELLKLKQVNRNDVYLLGVPCGGIVDPKKVAAHCDPSTITAIREENDTIILEGTHQVVVKKDNLLYDKCTFCAYPNPLVYDEMVGEAVTPRTFTNDEKFAGVEQLEEMDATDRLSYWNQQLSKCIRCYACKNVCPMCFCVECLWEKRDPKWVTKYPNPADTFTFHMIRAYHMIGRCTGCMECERVCPVDIPLGTIFQKIEKDCLELFEYQPGIDVDVVPPLNTYDEHDQSHEDMLR